MRAAVLNEFDGVPECRDFTDPPAEGVELAELLVAALNPIDLRIASGSWYGALPELPYVPGCEGVGRLTDGRRVWFMTPHNHGSFAERCAVDPARTVELPESLDENLAACLGIPGLAAWLALEWRAKIEPGEKVLVLGGSGPVGTFAVQIARLLGAGRVVAAARDPAGLQRALDLGADAIVNLAEVEDLAQAFREALQGEADITIDPLWGAPAAAASMVAAKRGRLVQLGQSADAEATLTSAAVRGNGLSILGFSNFEVPAEDLCDAYRKLAIHAAAGRLNMQFERYTLGQVPQAWERQRNGVHHKLLLAPT
jgi:NADPH:quinone reductase